MLIRRIAMTCFLLNLVACSTWTATNAPLRDLEDDRVRLTTAGGESISGRLSHSDSLGVAVLLTDGHKRVLVDTSEIMEVETRNLNTAATVGLVLVGATAVTLILIMVLVFDDPAY